MQKMVLPMLTAALLVLATNGSASANFTFNLVNVTLAASTSPFGPAGTLSGSFTTDNALSSVISANITASPAPNSDGFTFPGYTYNLSNSNLLTTNLPSLLQLNRADGNLFQLRLVFDGGLTASGARLVTGTTTTTSSFEFESGFGAARLVTAGSVVVATGAVPEPSSLAMAGVGLTGVAGYLRRRKAR